MWPRVRAIKPRYDAVERQFAELLALGDLDSAVEGQPALVGPFQRTVEEALAVAYEQADAPSAPHLFLQRVLYRINRMKLFWYDDLDSYANERSMYLRQVRAWIEEPWQRWERAQLDIVPLTPEQTRQALIERAALDVKPPAPREERYFRERVTEAGYRRLLEIASLDGLVEASQLSRTLGGVGNEIHAMLTRLLVEEYGGGKLARKHSSFFTAMLEEHGMRTHPEAYFGTVPWEVLATINHSFLLSERKRYFLRYIGGLLYTEISVPAAFESYRAAGARLGFSPAGTSYWDLHIREDERHGRWMLHDVAVPLIDRYPRHAWELVLGYDQQKLMSVRAGAVTVREARDADQAAQLRLARAG